MKIILEVDDNRAHPILYLRELRLRDRLQLLVVLEDRFDLRVHLVLLTDHANSQILGISAKQRTISYPASQSLKPRPPNARDRILHIASREGIEVPYMRDMWLRGAAVLPAALRETPMYPVECVMIVISHREDLCQQRAFLFTGDLRAELWVTEATCELEPGETLQQYRNLFLHARIPVIFNRVIRSPLDLFRDIRPAVAVSLMEEVEDPFFLVGPAVFLDMWV